MLASVSCISARLTQILSAPVRCAGAVTPGGMLLVTTSGSSAASRKAASLRVASSCGLLALNKTTPRASVTSTRSMSFSSSRRPAIEAMAGLLCAARRGSEQRPGDVYHALAAGLEVPSSFCSTVGVSETGDVGAVDPVLVVGEPAEQ